MTMLRGMASAVFVVWIAYGVQVMAPAMAQGAEETFPNRISNSCVRISGRRKPR